MVVHVEQDSPLFGTDESLISQQDCQEYLATMRQKAEHANKVWKGYRELLHKAKAKAPTRSKAARKRLWRGYKHDTSAAEIWVLSYGRKHLSARLRAELGPWGMQLRKRVLARTRRMKWRERKNERTEMEIDDSEWA